MNIKYTKKIAFDCTECKKKTSLQMDPDPSQKTENLKNLQKGNDNCNEQFFNKALLKKHTTVCGRAIVV